MTTYLTVVPVDGDRRRVQTQQEPTAALAVGGLASPYFGAFGSGPGPAVGGDDHLVFMAVRSPREVLARIQAKWVRVDRDRVFVTHGLACVGVSGNSDLAARALDLCAEFRGGFESWRLSAGLIDEQCRDFRGPVPEYVFSRSCELPDGGLPYEAATQVRQFRANLAHVGPCAALYFPEALPALAELEGHVATAIEHLVELGASQTMKHIQERHQIVSGLVELNAGMAMVSNQATGGVLPLGGCSSPVSEYSLFGIGTAWRAVFAVYSHLNRVFADAKHLARLETKLSEGHTVRSHTLRGNADYLDWKDSGARLSKLDVPEHGAVSRSHAVYFSSRQGFHETYTTMSAAWQAVHVSASREWSLSTISHEYIHTHVRDLVAWILDEADFEVLSRLWREAGPVPAKEGLQLVMLSSLRYVALVSSQLNSLKSGDSEILIDGWDGVPSPEEIAALAHGRSRRYAHELFVHVLDFLYTYGGQQSRYISAIWGSWAHVPSVSRRLHHYVLRTLCAIVGQAETAQGAGVAFEEAERTLDAALTSMLADHDSGVLVEAQNYLKSEVGRKRLQVEFSQAFPLVLFARYFLYDPAQVTSRLAQDPAEIVEGPGQTTLLAEAGDYLTERDNPTAFLLDQLRSYPAVASREDEFRSLWQMLLMVQ